MGGTEEAKSTTPEFAHGTQTNDFAAQQGARGVEASDASPVPLEAAASQPPSVECMDEGSAEAPAKYLRDAIRSGSKDTLDELLDRPGSGIELMAQNAANGAGLLMIAAEMGDDKMLEYLASKIKEKLGTRKLAKQLRFEDDDKKPLMFYAAKSSPEIFEVAQRLVRGTIDEVGLVEQLMHRSAIGGNILMEACNDPGTFERAWTLLKETDCLNKLLDEKDDDNKSWILYAAEAGNLAALSKLNGNISAFSSTDKKGWSGFMYAARGRGATNASFLGKICEGAKLVGDPRSEANIEKQLNRVAKDSDKSTLLMHAAIGGGESYSLICKLMRETGCVIDWRCECDEYAVLLSWAAEGGDIHVFEKIAQGIKTRQFPDSNSDRQWVSYSSDEADNLLSAISSCAKRPGRSLFISAVDSDTTEMIRHVGRGITRVIQNPKECWEMLCGSNGGNPLTVAAGKSVKSFKATLDVLKDAAETLGSRGGPKPEIIKLLLPDGETTPLCSAVNTENSLLFDEVLKTANALATQTSHGTSLSGSVILRQVRHAMTPVNQPGQPSEELISAKMLENVLKAAKKADRTSGGFKVKTLDMFMEKAVLLGAFDHISELLKNGCDLEKHFTAILRKIGKDEIDTSQCMILAITTARNPFRECGIASQAIYHAMEKRNKDYAALSRLQQKIGDLTLELLDHLPHTVASVGEELSRGHPDFEPFMHTPAGKVEPKRLLGFLVMGWMLEGWGHSSSARDLIGGENSLVQAVRSGPRALDFFSEPLVLDYLGIKFSRTLPDWDTQKPFKRNINQAFYRYKQRARRPLKPQQDPGNFQLLLLFLQGWEIDQETPQMPMVLPGVQFILAGIMGKPTSYYVVPMIRMAFVVISYIATIVLYLSCVSLQSRDIPWNEWLFYVVMLGVVWREALEFSNANKLEPGIGASIHRYFSDKWNFLDVLTVVVVFVAFVFRMMELVDGSAFKLFVAQLFLASAAPLLFSRLLFLSQAGGTLGPMTQVIFNMVAQLSRFSLILLIVMLGFAATFNALYDENTTLVAQNIDGCDVNDHPVVKAFGTVGAALLTMFVSMLGEFRMEIFTDRYENGEGGDCGGVIYQEAGVTLMVIYLIITTVMLLNLLIAVLSTAHSDVQKNAQKEFQLVRAQVILQSADHVKNDVLPPPFNLLKPVFGIIWLSTQRKLWDHWWEMITGTLHRLIFAFTVGLVALAISTILSIVSSPMHAWRISKWISKKAFSAKAGDGQSSQESNDDARRLSRRHGSASRLSGQSLSTFSHESSGRSNYTSGENDDVEESDFSLTRQSSFRRLSSPENEIKESEQRIFFLSSDDRQGTLSRSIVRSILFQIIRVPVVLLIEVFLCCVYPLLNVVLWLRGLVDILQYAQAMLRKTDPWERRQVDLGEEEEWSIARNHAVEMNRRFCGANKSSIYEFNVNALLKTTTGMSMKDLGQQMASLKSSRRHRALKASIDAVVTRFLPHEDNMDGGEIAEMEKKRFVASRKMKRKTS